ncbi:hypothetical protein LBMAG48_13650 [Phycisphaerae bacterium]|nr:hypothetical protein LBMAG48_13650 [Phycisphaerae bacterium]
MAQNVNKKIGFASGLLAVAMVAGLAHGQARTQGPDVIVGDLSDWATYTPFDADGAGPNPAIHAFAIGTTSCNIGTALLDWYTTGTANAQNPANFHPVIGQNLYRYRSVTLRDAVTGVPISTTPVGQFEQVGQSWLKHGFTALAQSLCHPCVTIDSTGATLDPTCSDPYTASLNGSQSRLGPRYQVNAFTGIYPYPVTGVPTVPSTATGGSIFRRLQVLRTDLDPALNSGAIYFGEGQYITQDDHPAETNIGTVAAPIWVKNAWNNVSWRRANYAYNATTGGTFTWNGSTQRLQSALFAWKSVQPTVQIVNVDVPSAPLPGTNVPAEGRFQIAYNVTDLGNGKWYYEYMVYNMFSDRSASSFAINIAGDGACVDVNNIGFKDVAYHSGEPYSGTDWASSKSNTQVKWETTETFAQNANANALRWGTSYTYRFVSDRAPVAGTATIGLFKPATALSTVTSVNANIMVPQGGNCGCDIDFNNNAVFPEDQDVVDFFDVLAGSACVACDSIDFNRNGVFPEDQDVIDFFDVLAGGTCPY